MAAMQRLAPCWPILVAWIHAVTFVTAFQTALPSSMQYRSGALHNASFSITQCHLLLRRPEFRLGVGLVKRTRMAMGVALFSRPVAIMQSGHQFV